MTDETQHVATADLKLVLLNDISRVNRTCGEQAGGTACSFSLWTKKAIP
jgi:hypothetical protein